MWQQLSLLARAENAAALESMLLEHGAVAISYLDAEDQPIFQEEPGSTPMWESSVMRALFPADSDLQALTFLLRHSPAVLNGDDLTVEPLADQDWERSWMDDFQAMRFGDNLWICPSWQQPPDPNAVNLKLDPGLAFGSGTHNTTALCLRWLARQPPEKLEVIDYGCGSGVLALAAVLLGAELVHAVDNDPLALIATRSNAERNDIAESRLRCYEPEQLPAFQVDCLLANILAQPLIELAPRLIALLRPGGRLILSGLLREQIDAVQSAYAGCINFDDPELDAGWVCLTGLRRA